MTFFGAPRKLVIVFWFVLTGLGASAQDTPPAGGQAGVPPDPFQHLTLSFVVRDEHRHPVGNLKAGDVQILENGQPQTLETFRRITVATAGSSTHREITLVVDAGSNESLALAREFVRSGVAQAGSGTEWSIWDTRQLALVQPFTADASLLAKALSASEPVSAAPADGSAAAAPEVSPTVRDARSRVENDHCRPRYASLAALIKERGLVSGRKEIVYFAANEDAGDVTENQIRALVSNATRASVSIYVADPDSLSASAEAHAVEMLSGKKKRGEQRPAQNKTNMLRELAERSGGVYAKGLRGSAEEIRSAAIADLTDYFEAVYTPGPQVDGQFRAIAVKVSHPRMTARAPAGYFSVPTQNCLDVAPFAPALLSALQTSPAKQDFPIEVEAIRFGHAEKRANAALAVEIPLSVMSGQTSSTGKTSLHFSVLALVRRADGRIASEMDQDVPYEQDSQHGTGVYTFEGPLTLSPGEYRAAVAVRDENAETVSTREISFSIPEAKDAVDVADIVIVRDAESNARSRHENSPLWMGRTRIMPYAGSSVPMAPNGMLPVLVTAYAAVDHGAPDLELQVDREQELVGRFPLLASRDEAGRYRALIWLPQESLSTGRYTLTARATQGKLTAERKKTIDLTPPRTESQRVQLADASGGPSPAAASALAATSLAEEHEMSELFERELTAEDPKALTAANRVSDARASEIWSKARERALDYKRDLPNFICVEMTRRFTGRLGEKGWHPRDSIAELLGYSSGTEQYETIEVNGHPQHTNRSNFTGVRANGEFGELLDAVFSDAVAAEFKWRGERKFDGVDVYVFEYRVPRARSVYGLSTSWGHTRVFSEFRGVVYIDAGNFDTRYVSVRAENVPTEAMYRESTLTLTYDYFAVGGRKFLLPKTSVLIVRIGKRSLMKNEMQFRNYRRYQSKSRILP